MREKKKHGLFLVVLCLILGLCVCSGTVFAKDTKQVNKYVVLGDSIAAGYLQEGYVRGGTLPETSYAARVGKELSVTPINHAWSGITSMELLEQLKNGAYDASLEGAELVTLSVGSNDLLRPFTDCVNKVLGADIAGSSEEELMKVFQEKYNPMTETGLKNLQEKWKELRKELLASPAIKEAPDKFANTFSEIIEEIRKKAPDARILVTSFYNPYRTFNLSLPGIIDFDLGNICGKNIDAMNQALRTKKEGYELVDVFPVYEKYSCVNASFSILNMSSFSMDPHPNTYGHEVISELVLNTWNPERVFDKISVKKKISMKEGKKGKVKITMPKQESGRWSPYADAEITYQSSKEGVVKVNSKGRLTAEKAGTAKVEVAISLNGVEKKYQVKVRVS